MSIETQVYVNASEQQSKARMDQRERMIREHARAKVTQSGEMEEVEFY